MLHSPPIISSMSMKNLDMPKEHTLSNGIKVYTNDGCMHNVVRLDILFKGGQSVETQPLEAMFANRMLREGTKTKSSLVISQTLDYYGAWIDIFSSLTSNHITLYTLSKYFEELLSLLEELIKYPVFSTKRLDTIKKNNKSFFLINSQKVEVVAQRNFSNLVWGNNHPIGRFVEAGDYDRINRDVLQQYYDKTYNPANCSMMLSGNLDDSMIKSLEKHFGSDIWNRAAEIAKIPQFPEYKPQADTLKIDFPDALQSAIKIGYRIPESEPRDLHLLRFLSVILGGYFGSRLMANIREEKGYAYYIESDLSTYGGDCSLIITTEAANEFVEPLIKEIYLEFEKLRNETIPSQELERVRNYTLGELSREYEGPIAKSEVFINAWLASNSYNSVNAYLDVVRTVTAEELKSTANKYLLAEKMLKVVVGK